MDIYQAEARLKGAKVAMGSVFGWGPNTPEKQALKIRVAERAGANPTQEQMADAIAQETGLVTGVVEIRHRTWVRSENPAEEEELNPNGRGTVLYQA